MTFYKYLFTVDSPPLQNTFAKNFLEEYFWYYNKNVRSWLQQDLRSQSNHTLSIYIIA